MRVLLTGASSFSGLWFAQALAASGAEVVAPLRGAPAAYAGVRAKRVERLGQIAEIVPDCVVGDEKFLALAGARGFDALCHHAAQVGDYRSLDFDVTGAVAANTRNFRQVLERMLKAGLKAVVATGSVFEQDEGAGEAPMRAFSPYGLSKGLTWQVLRHWCAVMGAPLSKFVIANPFGPYEEPRFGAYLVATWRKGEVAEVRTPRYLRDNIHVDLLGLTYAKFVHEAAASGVGRRFGPCGYLETQGAFAERMGRELAPRLGLEGRVRLLTQTDFSEPLARINTDVVAPAAYGWDEAKAWDGMAEAYKGL